MRPPKVEEQDLLPNLLAVLSAKGYDGASLNDLAAAAGLQKASLYHRYPGGKQAITEAVMEFVHEWVETRVKKVLASTAPPEERLSTVLQNINSLYAGGDKPCILRALSMSSSMTLFGTEVKKNMDFWVEGFTALGKDLGMNPIAAQESAVKVLMFLQGGLVVAQGMGNRLHFQKALGYIAAQYSGG